jgi:hypothetical protein
VQQSASAYVMCMYDYMYVVCMFQTCMQACVYTQSE